MGVGRGGRGRGRGPIVITAAAFTAHQDVLGTVIAVDEDACSVGRPPAGSWDGEWSAVVAAVVRLALKETHDEVFFELRCGNSRSVGR